ncbi:MAG: long-chain fatty acid--CoA ligase [Pirellulales bacterium]|nr:long-chain fatty acid--CoA ligase [Pirellulales bacterium]
MIENSSAEMTPEPMLAAIDDYRGTIFDLDHSLRIGPELFAASRTALARRMRSAGLKTADRVIVAVGNGPLFIAVWAGILAEGGSPLLAHVESPPAELKRIAKQFLARFIVTDAQDESDMEAVGARANVLSYDLWARVIWADLADHVDFRSAAPLALPGVPLHPTSGTTGKPKVAVRPVATAIAEAKHYVETIGVDRNDTLLAVAPMSHAYGHGWYVITPMVTGANLVTMRRFNAKTVFDACKKHQVTILPAVASMLDTLMFGAGRRLYNPQRRVITGGAPMTLRTAANFEKISGTRARPLFGTTEAGAIAVARSDEQTAGGGCVGRPFDGVSIEIRPPADPSEFGPDLGLVHVRSSSVMAGYLNEEKLDTSVLPDGWFNTGDLGWIDEHGALHLRGRQAEVINVSGMKVLPSEVEEVIASLPGVVEAKVYPGQTRQGSYYVKAAVVVDKGLDAARIKAHCQEHLVYFKRPGRIILMDALPRSSRGKIMREQLP